MASLLNYDVARQKETQLARQAERARQEQAAVGPAASAHHRRPARNLMVRLRLRQPVQASGPSR